MAIQSVYNADNGYTQDRAQTVAVPTAGLSNISALIFGAGPVVGAVTAVVGILAALGITVRGKTQHFSYEQAHETAIRFTDAIWAIFYHAYSYEQLQVIAAKVAPRFLSAMYGQWGVDTTLNQQIFLDVQQNYLTEYALNRQLVLFGDWIGTNIDADRADEEYRTVMPSLFDAIFIGAIADAGLSTEPIAKYLGKLPGAGPVPTPNPTPGPKPIGDFNLAGLFQGNSTSVLLLGGILIGGYFLLKKGN